MARDDVVGHFIDIQILITRADSRQRLLRAESATAATANVIFAKESALGPRELHEQFPHGDVRVDGSGVHCAKVKRGV
jgi:hypothetical protein